MSGSLLEYQLVEQAADFIRKRMPFALKVGIIQGTGLGRWTNALDIHLTLNTAEIPNLPQPKVASHKGKLTFAMINAIPLVIAGGRVHYYEGHTMNEVVRMVRILYSIGCRYLIITNAAGGLNPSYQAGDLVLIRDHINLMGDNPLRGPNEDRWGPRFPDMTKAYDPAWIAFTLNEAAASGITLHTGVYAGNAGPSLETPAEYAYLHQIGADLVGMSAVPEVIAANHIGFSTLGISVVSNVCYPPERLRETSIEDVIKAAQSSAPKLGALVERAIRFVIND